ncbi:Riboflavin biosynthesis protein RibD [Buchnera aphidicola (Eriosoma grossulariae)]|uniref:bifunctional diaminohydroxyphosphoribosylaminopyrimidine deaminase/5-amino-6-(5-phosphoribosylamino)uracil reductase RibD n=1 Tax=Buchnera aphidicola TaxID=9 RepID=UPI0034648375
MNDIFYMKEALKLAEKGKLTTAPNPNVGCIIVKNKKIIGMGWHKKPGDLHAEIIAINMAKENTFGSTAYVTLEPCNHYGKTPPCCQKLLTSGIQRIVIATIDPNPKVSGKGIDFLKKNGIIINYGIMEKEAKEINKNFFKRMKTGLPWTQLKLGVSLDGRIALNNGESKWITSHTSRKDVHKFRSQNQVILSSSKTIINDNPLLNVRYKNINENKEMEIINQPIRIIIDSKNKIQPNHPTIKMSKNKIWLIRIKKDNQQWPNHVKQIISCQIKKKIDLLKLLLLIGKNEINSVWIEAGSSLSGSLIEKNLIDELILYMSPKLLGQTAKPMFIFKKFLKINQTTQFLFHKIDQFNTDIRIILRKNKNFIVK